MTKQIEEFKRLRSNPGALVNTNDEALESYRTMRANRYAMMDKINEINNIQDDVTSLKDEITDIKNMLSQLLEKYK